VLYFNIIEVKEGLRVKRLDSLDDDVPYVPNDAACMILYSMGINVDRMEYLKNKCRGKTTDLKDDNSNICRA
jgi:hypothetical protein